jgi:CPA2 family monovalent cation:H+ antiporter-2
MFLVIDKLSEPSVTPAPKVIAPAKELPSTIDEKPTTLTGHAVLVGHGRVGSHVAASLLARFQLPISGLLP